MKISLKGKGFSALAGMAGAVIALVGLVAFCIYGAMYAQYADVAVGIFLLLGAACSVCYALIDVRITEILPVAATFCVSFALGLFIVNSYNVWADWNGGANFFGSEGGVTPVIILAVIDIIAVLCNILSAFTGKKGGAQA